MFRMSTIGRGVAVAAAAGLLSLGFATTASADAPTGSDANQPENWETYLVDEGYVDVECMKYEEGFDGDTWVSDDDYLLVVLKYATINEEFWFVEEDEELSTETGQDISHVIACYGDEPSSTSTPTPTKSSTPTKTSTPTTTSTPTSTRPTGPVVETDVPASDSSNLPVLLGGAAVLAGAGLVAGALRRREGQH